MPLSPRSRIVESVRATRAIRSNSVRIGRLVADHVVLEVDLGAQLLVAILETSRLVPLFARDGRQRSNDQEQTDVPFVECRARRGLGPQAARGTTEGHERQDDRLPTVNLDDDGCPFARGALEQDAIN